MSDLLAEGAAANEKYVRDALLLDMAFLRGDSEFEAVIDALFQRERDDESSTTGNGGGAEA